MSKKTEELFLALEKAIFMGRKKGRIEAIKSVFMEYRRHVYIDKRNHVEPWFWRMAFAISLLGNIVSFSIEFLR